MKTKTKHKLRYEELENRRMLATFTVSDDPIEITNSIIAENIYSGVGVEFDIGGLFSQVNASYSVIGIDPGITV